MIPTIIWLVGLIPALLILVEVYEDAAVAERWRTCRRQNLEFDETDHRRRVRAWLGFVALLWPLALCVRIVAGAIAVVARRPR